MDKARAAVSDFVGRSGKHDTTVEQGQASSVTQEQVKPTRHENVTSAVDREVHQDHFHTTVQPIQDRQVLPEQHSHQMADVQHRDLEHGNPRDTQARLDREASQFKDATRTLETKNTKAVAPTVEGEHVHHHVHETIQPVVERETIAPSVVHTTVPIHETHHNAPEHHGVSVLPTKTMGDYTSGGHGLGQTGITDKGGYEGCPQDFDSETQAGGATRTAGPHHSNLANKADPRVDSDRDGRGLGQGTGTSGTGAGHHDRDRDGRGLGQGTGTGTSGVGAGHNTHAGDELDPRVDGRSTTGANTGPGSHLGRGAGSGHEGGADAVSAHGHGTGHVGQKKPSLMDRLNPMKDSDGDGKKGFMK